jgi:hypothetical protein
MFETNLKEYQKLLAGKPRDMHFGAWISRMNRKALYERKGPIHPII